MFFVIINRKLGCFFISGHDDGGFGQLDTIDGSDGVADQTSDLFGVRSPQFDQKCIFAGHIMYFLDMGAKGQFFTDLDFIGVFIDLTVINAIRPLAKKFGFRRTS